MRHAHTINDVAELLRDKEVTILLTDRCIVEFRFPKTKEELAVIKKNQHQVDAFYGHYQNPTPSIQRRRHSTYVVRSLVRNPRFWRLTTTATQLGSFCRANNKLTKSKYGTIRVIKKANDPLYILFKEQKFAKKFFIDINKSKFFKKIKV